MFATVARMSKASRKPLSAKRANKDYYKGNRQAFLPGGHRTGAPGQHVVRGKAKYRLIDEKVRVFVAPPIEEINNFPLKPYVAIETRYDKKERSIFPSWPHSTSGVTPEWYLKQARSEYLKEQAAEASAVEGPSSTGASSTSPHELEVVQESKPGPEKQESVRA